MSKARKFRKIVLKSEVLSIEEEEFNEADLEYLKQFNEDFKDEIAFLSRLAGPDNPPPSPPAETCEDESSSQVDRAHLKPLHKELAVALHPDLNPDLGDEDFKRMQEAYENGDVATLIRYASENGVEVELDDESLEKIENQISSRRHDIKAAMKDMVRWVWGSSDKNQSLREQIWQVMNVNPQAFEEWKKNKP